MRNFAAVGTRPYIGTPALFPSDLCKPLTQEPFIVPVTIQWATYQAALNAAANVGVDVALQVTGANQLKKIASVYIDNLGSDVPVYVYFPDTGYTIPAKPGSADWYPAITNTNVCKVYALGLTPVDLSQTTVILANFPMQSFANDELPQTINLWKASPTITRGANIYNTNYGAPALGDQFKRYQSFGPSPGTQALWGTPIAGNFVYLTGLFILNNEFSTGAGNTNCNFFIESTGISGLLIQVPYLATTTRLTQVFWQQLKFNLKLDASESWQLRATGAIANGSMDFYFDYTISPVI